MGDPAAICLAEWIERGRGYRNSTVWAQWVEETKDKLEQHLARQKLISELVHEAKMALIGHDLAVVRDRLDGVEGVLDA